MLLLGGLVQAAALSHPLTASRARCSWSGGLALGTTTRRCRSDLMAAPPRSSPPPLPMPPSRACRASEPASGRVSPRCGADQSALPVQPHPAAYLARVRTVCSVAAMGSAPSRTGRVQRRVPTRSGRWQHERRRTRTRAPKPPRPPAPSPHPGVAPGARTRRCVSRARRQTNSGRAVATLLIESLAMPSESAIVGAATGGQAAAHTPRRAARRRALWVYADGGAAQLGSGPTSTSLTRQGAREARFTAFL